MSASGTGQTFFQLVPFTTLCRTRLLTMSTLPFVHAYTLTVPGLSRCSISCPFPDPLLQQQDFCLLRHGSSQLRTSVNLFQPVRQTCRNMLYYVFQHDTNFVRCDILPPHASIFSVELSAILLALRTQYSLHVGRFAIFCDYTAVLCN